MRVWTVAMLLAATAVLATVPVTPQLTQRGIELRLDEANAITYRRARVTYRRAYRRGARASYYRGGYYRGYSGGCRC
jgi:hypothetical protein